MQETFTETPVGEMTLAEIEDYIRSNHRKDTVGLKHPTMDWLITFESFENDVFMKDSPSFALTYNENRLTIGATILEIFQAMETFKKDTFPSWPKPLSGTDDHYSRWKFVSTQITD